MSLQNPKTLRKYPENLQPQIFWPVIFKNGDALQIKLWNCVNFSFFYLKLFSVFIMNIVPSFSVKVVKLDRSRHWRCSVEKVFLETLQNLQQSTCSRVSFLIKLQASGTGVFLWVFAKFLGTPFLKEHLLWLLLVGHMC